MLFRARSLSYLFLKKFVKNMDIELRKAGKNPKYEISNIRFEHDSGAYMTIWFDIGGPAFAEPEAMKNMYVDLSDLLDCLPSEQNRFYRSFAAVRAGRVTPTALDWDTFLRGYIDQRVDLRAEEQVRLGWMNERRKRQSEESDTGTTDWANLSREDASPSWDDVAHAVIESLNDTAVRLYPELLDCGPEHTEQLREVLESHGERLANQLYALARSVRQVREN
jgi:hypothetical protein